MPNHIFIYWKQMKIKIKDNILNNSKIFSYLWHNLMNNTKKFHISGNVHNITKKYQRRSKQMEGFVTFIDWKIKFSKASSSPSLYTHTHTHTHTHTYLFIKWKVELLVAQYCPATCDSIDCSLPDSSVCVILQAITLEWVAIPFSRGSSQPWGWTGASCSGGWFFPTWAARRALHTYSTHCNSC